MAKVTVWLVGAFAIFASAVFVLEFSRELLNRQEIQSGLIAFGILVFVLWFLWTQLPKSLREMVYRSLKRKRGTRTD